METIFSTNDLHPRDRFDYWHEVVTKNLVPHDAEPDCRQTFEAELQLGRLAEAELLSLENSTLDFSVMPQHLTRAAADDLYISRQTRGFLALEQNGREIVLEPGDLTLIDPLLPHSGRFWANSKSLVFKAPRRLLEARIGKTRTMTLRPIRPPDDEHSLTSSFLAMLPGHIARLSAAAKAMVQDTALDLIAVSLTKAMDSQTPRVSSSRSLALLKVRAAIGAELTNPDLDAGKVAARAGISVRYANAVLADEGMSIMQLIRQKRLARCRRALEDPSQAHRTISEIAYGWGFSDMTHFGRNFKAAYGVAPRDYRRQAVSA